MGKTVDSRLYCQGGVVSNSHNAIIISKVQRVYFDCR